MNNPIQWVEIEATDLERAKEFYSSVFGLELQLMEMPDSKMYMFGAPEQQVHQGVWSSPRLTNQALMVLLFISLVKMLPTNWQKSTRPGDKSSFLRPI
ncbi:MAG: hypothetical protein OEM26_21975 [Saprospiraceae bacterium]|nr:hypothetical protein [Saprospiraceae bacterium]